MNLYAPQPYVNDNDVNIECIFDEPAILGECPLWHPVENVLYWIDIVKPALHCLDIKTAQHQMWPMPTNICCIAAHRQGGLVAAMRSEFVHIDLPSGKLFPIAAPITAAQPLMFNDGKCDRQGRFWAGTKDVAEKNAIASLYRLNQAGECQTMVTQIVETNGIAWSPDNKKMYFCDTLPRLIHEYDFDPTTGDLGEHRLFTVVTEGVGLPDGLTVDAAGYLWSVHWNGWRIVRYSPEGKIDREIFMPVQRPTSCCFGGNDYQTLYVTSVSKDLTTAELKQGPLAGGVFAINIPNMQGLPEPCYGFPPSRE
jgi:sugar lactone lactonase YvrE